MLRTRLARPVALPGLSMDSASGSIHGDADCNHSLRDMKNASNRLMPIVELIMLHHPRSPPTYKIPDPQACADPDYNTELALHVQPGHQRKDVHQQRRPTQHSHAITVPIANPLTPIFLPAPPRFLCLYPSCNAQHKRHADLARHVQIVHNRATLSLIDCEYDNIRKASAAIGPSGSGGGGGGGGECSRKGANGFTRRDKMIEHMRDVHKCAIPKRKGGGRRASGPAEWRWAAER
nr:hypothetical protein CFP56_21203 [Quercus suber]